MDFTEDYVPFNGKGTRDLFRPRSFESLPICKDMSPYTGRNFKKEVSVTIGKR